MTTSEIQNHADFSRIRYANCWEDADVLIAASSPHNKHCLGIGSAGDNCFSLLAAGAVSVRAIEMNPAQTACIQLRRAAYLTLNHQEFLILLGESSAQHHHHRRELFARCLTHLEPSATEYWQHFPEMIDNGFAQAGKFENYFTLFRTRALRLVHTRSRIESLLKPKSRSEREEFYETTWNTWRWRALFRVFFSRLVMGRLGRDPAFFKYVEGSVADRILSRARHALVELDPSANPYLRWILNGNYGDHFPHALREENFDLIRNRLDDFHIVDQSLEAALEDSHHYDVFNLSDIFEYMSPENTTSLLQRIIDRSNPGARLVYWNMLAPRSRPESLASKLEPLESLAKTLFNEDKAFFYSRLIIEQTPA